MNRRTLAICDPEQAYACRLMDALSRREDFPFEVLALREQSVYRILSPESRYRFC